MDRVAGMDRLLVVRHEPNDTLGVARWAFEEEGLRLRILDAWAEERWPSPREFAGVVLMGGAMNVDQVDRHPYLGLERDLVRRAIDEDLPIIGVCLGAQLMARALGQPVVRAPIRRCGFFPVYPTEDALGDPVGAAFAPGDLEFHWNEDTFDLPSGATLLASGTDGAVEAYRLGARAWGIAFHPEVDRPELAGWIESAGDTLEPVWHRAPEDVKREADRLLPAHQERGRNLFRQLARSIRTVPIH